MKAKLLTMAALAVIVVTAALLWLMDAKVQDERRIASEVGLRGPVNALSQALQADLRGLRLSLASGAPFSKDHVEWASFKPFFAFAQVHAGKGQSQIVRSADDGAAPESSWTPDKLASMVVAAGVNPASGEIALAVVTSPEKKKILATVIRQGDDEWVAFSGLEFLQGLIDLQKGPKGWLGILNSNGQVLAHTVDEYVGTKVSQGSLSDQIRTDASARGYENMQADGEDNLVAYEKPDHSNLVIVAARPTAEISADRRKSLIFGGIAGLGLLLVALSAMWSVLNKAEEQTARMLLAARTAAPVGKNPDKPALAEVTPAMSPKERQETFTRIASTIGHELRSPMVAIIGYAQMILSKSNDIGVTGPVDSILRETRSAREIVDKLLAFAGDVPEEKKPTRVETVLTTVLKEFEPRFAKKVIKVTKELNETSELALSPKSLENSIRHILNNAIEGMERMPKKNLTIRLIEDPIAVSLEIQDNGEGIDAKDRERVFDPFFSTRQSSQHLGMGLPAALGLIHEQGGELRLHSELGKGTTVTIVLLKGAKFVNIGGTEVQLKTWEQVEIPAGIPVNDELTPVVAPAASLIDVDIDHLLAPSEVQAYKAPAEPVVEAVKPPEPARQASEDKITPPRFSPPSRPADTLAGIPVSIRRPGARS